MPQSLLDKADAIRQNGGAEVLDKLLVELPELLKRNKDILDEVSFFKSMNLSIIFLKYNFHTNVF